MVRRSLLVLLSILTISDFAYAQDESLSTAPRYDPERASKTGTLLPAPIGHRQPTRSSLPPETDKSTPRFPKFRRSEPRQDHAKHLSRMLIAIPRKKLFDFGLSVWRYSKVLRVH